MKSKLMLKRVLLFITALTLLYGFSGRKNTGTMILEFSNVEPSKGCVNVRLYNSSEKFLVKNGPCHKCKTRVGKEKTVKIIVDDLPYGDYAVAAFYDENCNDQLDKNFIGLPKEPYAFSRPYSVKTRKPRFNEVSISFKKDHQVIHMEF